MAVEFDNVSSGTPVTNGSSISWSHTVGSGENRIILVALASGGSNPLGGSAAPTVNGTPCTQLHFHTRDTTPGGTAWRIGVWYCLDPASGSVTVAHDEGGSVQFLVGGAISYSGVDQVDPFGDSDEADGLSNPGALSLDIASAIDGMVVDFLVQNSQSARELTAGSGQTERIDSPHSESGSAPFLKASDKAGDTSVAMTWSNDVGATNWTHFAVALNADGSVELTIGDGVHGQASDSAALTQAHTLSVGSSAHVHVSANVALSQAYVLSTADSVHVQAADALNLTQASALDVGGSAHGHVADNISLAQAIALAVADSVHAQLADGPSLSQAYALQIGDAIHAHVAEALELSQAQLLAIASSAHSHAADEAALSSADFLSIGSSAHGHAANEADLVQAAILTIGDSVHTVVSAQILLNQSATLAIGEAIHGMVADGVTLSHGAVLAIASAVHLQAADAIELTQATTIVVSDSVHAHIASLINLLMPGGAAVPPGRTIVVHARSRVIVIQPESRTIKVH